MASDAAAFESGNGASPDPCAHHPEASRDVTFFRRVVRANGVLSDVMKSSAIKIAESQKLLAKVDDLLRR